MAKNIIVVGSANIDYVYSVDKLPVLGETVFGSNLKRFIGGKGLNQAVAASRVVDEFAVIFIGSFGNSKAFFLEQLAAENLDFSNVYESETPSGSAFITLSENDNSIVVIPGANNCLTTEYIQSILSLITCESIVLLQNEISQTINNQVIEHCYKVGATTIYNPAPARDISSDILDKVTFFTPNETEVSDIFNSSYEAVICKYPNKVLVTLGSKGVSYCDGEKIINIAAPKTDVVDTTGAGDTFNGLFASFLAKDYPLTSAIEFAVKGASYSVTKLGAQAGMPSIDFFKSLK